MGKAHKNCTIGKILCHRHITGTAFIIRVELYVYSIQFNSIYSSKHTHIIITNIPQYNSPYV